MKYGIVRSIGIISLFTLLTSVCSFVFQLVIARVFGAGYNTDTFFLAFSIPEWFIQIISLIFPAAMVPAFSSYRALKQEEKSWQIIYSFLVWFGILFVIIYSGVIVFHLPLAEILAGNLPYAYRTDLGLHLLILVPFVLFSSLSALWTGYLYSHEKVLLPSITPLIQAAASVVFIYLFKPWCGIFAASVSILSSSILQCGILAFFSLRMRIRTRFTLFSKPLKDVLVLMLPILLGNIIFKSSVIVDRYLATFLTAGSVSAMYYASRIIRLSARATSSGLIRVFFPKLAHSAAIKENKQFSKDFSVSTGAALYFAFPIALGLVLFAPNIISILFQGDKFDAATVALSAMALIGFVGTYLVSPLSDLLANSFFAIKDTRTVILVQLIFFVPSVILKIIMVQVSGLIGLCMISSSITVITSAVLMLLLKRKTRHISILPIVVLALKCLAACVIIGLPMIIFGFPFSSPFVGLSRWLQLPAVGGVSLAMLAAYILLGRLFKNPLSQRMVDRMVKIFRRSHS